MFLRAFLIFSVLNYLKASDGRNFSLLINFTCAVAKDELEKHPEMRTIAMVELENNFPSDFSAKVLKCLPNDVAKIVFTPFDIGSKRISIITLPKESMIIYVADELNMESTFIPSKYRFRKVFPVVHHLSKRLILTSDQRRIKESFQMFTEFISNVALIYGQDQKVIAKSFDKFRNFTTFETFESSQVENLSQILFPDRTKNLNGQELYAVYTDSDDAERIDGSDKPNCKWTHFLDVVANQLNATLTFIEIPENKTSWWAFFVHRQRIMMKLIMSDRLDFYLNYENAKFDLESYDFKDWCYVAPLPPEYSIIEQILILPLDNPCWMWLGITVAVSTLVWRISEGHWNFFFGAFAYFVGQSQNVVRVRTSRLTMKILLQILILTIFIFSNGYQSLVTSFMLNPVKQNLLKTYDDLLDSDLKIEWYEPVELTRKNDPKYQKAVDDRRMIVFDQIENWTEVTIKKHLAAIQICKQTKNKIEQFGDGKSYKKLYMIEEVVSSIPEDLFTRPYHKLIENFQQIMDRMFEAGMPKVWEKNFYEVFNQKSQKFERHQTKRILDFQSIAPFFVVFAVGFVGALLALLCEIFYKDFVSELSKEYFERKFGIRKKREKVKRIKVKPVRRAKSV